LVDDHGLGGRRIGAMADGRWKQWRQLELSAGIFQSNEPEQGGRREEDAAARLSFRPINPLEIGANGYVREVFAARQDRAIGSDATLRLGPFSATGEILGGRLAAGTFRAGLIRSTYDFAVESTGRWILQPVLAAEHLALWGAAPGQGLSAVVGANLWLEDRFRVSALAERALRPGDISMDNELAVQVGARF
jgi:hypothetical protein